MTRIRCAACDQPFTPRKNVPHQEFCSARSCQRERRRRWQKARLKTDVDYRDNQAAAQKRWREKHPDYSRRYRQSHPEYTATNREKQRQRNRRRQPTPSQSPPAEIAKMDEYVSENQLASGTYRIIPVSGPAIAKMHEYFVEMRFISGA